MATAFMTGIVAETDRFSNTKTSPRTMALASELMSAGANQQLIASKLEAAQDIPEVVADDTVKKTDEPVTEEAAADGSLQIAHEEPAALEESTEKEAPEEESQPEDLPEDTAKSAVPDDVDDIFGGLASPATKPTESPALPPIPETPAGMPSRASMALDPPTMGGQLTANSVPESMQTDASTDPLSLPAVPETPAEPPQILNRPAGLAGTPIQPANQSLSASEPTPTEEQAPDNRVEELGDARDAVNQAIAAEPSTRPLDPIQALGAQPVDLNLRSDTPAPQAPLSPPTDEAAPSVPETSPVPETPAPTPTSEPTPAPLPITPAPNPDAPPFGAPPDMNGVNPNNPTVPPSILPPSQPTDATAAGTNNPAPPPPVPPPLVPPSDAI
jgi:hypothetical protein